MSLEQSTVKLLGVRGSVPVSGAEFARYGGATTCVLVHWEKQYLILDAGTGLLRLDDAVLQEPELTLLLTHAHADHLLGLPLCPYLMRRSARMDIYGATRGGMTVASQVGRLLSPPLWPVGADSLPATIRWHELPGTLRLGALTVETMEGIHPDGVSLLRVTDGQRSVVMITDCTITRDILPELRRFAGGCDLLLCDGQYSEAEWEDRAAFGHSTWISAARLAAECDAKRLRIIHHDPKHTDAVLDAAEQEVKAIFPNGAFAYEGEEVPL